MEEILKFSCLLQKPFFFTELRSVLPFIKVIFDKLKKKVYSVKYIIKKCILKLSKLQYMYKHLKSSSKLLHY